jgi:hypothetical protein
MGWIITGLGAISAPFISYLRKMLRSPGLSPDGIWLLHAVAASHITSPFALVLRHALAV